MQDDKKALQMSAEDYLIKGIQHQRKGDLEAALAAFDRAIQLDERFAEAYNARGNVYQLKGELDKALEDYNHAIAIKPFAAPFNNRANLYVQRGRFDSAINDYHRAIELAEPVTGLESRGVAHLYFNRAIAWYRRGDLDNAIKDCNEALSLDQRFFMAYLLRGGLYFEIGQYGNALEDFDAADGINPTQPPVLGGMVAAYYANGKVDEALQSWNILTSQNVKYRDFEWVETVLNWPKPIVDTIRKFVESHATA